MKVIITGGGTGGHVNPALAIASAIEEREKNPEIIYVGTPNGIENKLVPDKYKMYHVDIQGLRRSLSPANIKTAYLTVTSFFKAKALLKELKPDLVVGTGGYVCWPVVRAAAALKIPCALHESNAVPGFAVKMLEKKADIIFVNFEKTKEFLLNAKKVVFSGTPVRSGFYTYDRNSASAELGTGKYKYFLLSFGGSLGADRINEEILNIMKNYSSKHPDMYHVHAAGSRNYSAMKERFEAMGLDKYKNLVFADYIYDQPRKMAASDLVICRSGALSLAELAVAGKPAILIPSPNVTNDQQTKNARLLASSGAADMISEDELSEGKLTQTVEALLRNKKKREEMSEKVKKFAMRNSRDVIYKELKMLVEAHRIK